MWTKKSFSHPGRIQSKAYLKLSHQKYSWILAGDADKLLFNTTLVCGCLKWIDMFALDVYFCLERREGFKAELME